MRCTLQLGGVHRWHFYRNFPTFRRHRADSGLYRAQDEACTEIFICFCSRPIECAHFLSVVGTESWLEDVYSKRSWGSPFRRLGYRWYPILHVWWLWTLQPMVPQSTSSRMKHFPFSICDEQRNFIRFYYRWMDLQGAEVLLHHDKPQAETQGTRIACLCDLHFRDATDKRAKLRLYDPSISVILFHAAHTWRVCWEHKILNHPKLPAPIPNHFNCEGMYPVPSPQIRYWEL